MIISFIKLKAPNSDAYDANLYLFTGKDPSYTSESPANLKEGPGLHPYKPLARKTWSGSSVYINSLPELFAALNLSRKIL